MTFIVRNVLGCFSLAAFAMSGCTAAQSLPPEAGLVHEHATVKPGASVEITFEAPKNIAVGEYGVLKLIIQDYYDAGTLNLVARPEEGLRFVSETGRKTLSMSGDDQQEWELDFIGTADGVYYVDVSAIVDLPDGNQSARAFSGRVNIGDIQKAKNQRTAKRNGVLSEDGSKVIMQGTETIK